MSGASANIPPSLELLQPADGPVRRAFRSFNRWPIMQVAMIGLLVICALFADIIAPYDPIDANLKDRREPPIWSSEGNGKYVLGADLQGRDLLSRIIHGTRVSLSIAGISIGLGMLVGTGYGLISGYVGGWIDEVLMRIVDVFLAFPLIMAALFLLVLFGSGYGTVIGVLVLFSWVAFARQVRAETLALKTSDYVALAEVAGASTFRVLFKHILPGVVNTIMVIATLNIGGLILTESVLSYLGVGIPPPTPAWGAMVADGKDYLSTSWQISFFPGMAIFLTVMAFNFLGDWTRDFLDPRLRQVM